MKFDEVMIKIQPGDIITSKKGMLSKSPISKEWFIYKKAEYLGNGAFKIIGEKYGVMARVGMERKANMRM